MSGIVGIIHFDGEPVEPRLIEQMTGAIAHRGPDGINHWVKGSVGLGQCMLRTTPESLEEHQPLTNEDQSLVLVMDGRVDNWEELRRELRGRGAVLRDLSDAELVLRAYQHWGRDCLSRIEGDFALVIWDVRRGEAFCARDRMGQKPFNYHWNGTTFVFSSELHAILALRWTPEILNEGMVAEFLAAEWYSRDETFWKGVLRLVAAHHAVVDKVGPTLTRYWEPDLEATLPYRDEEQFSEHYRALLIDVVRRMSRSAQPVACEASGGLDSSAVFAVAESLLQEQELPAPALDGYVLDFSGDPEADELKYSRALGEYLGVCILETRPSRMSLSWYREVARRYREFPSYPNGVMGLGIRMEAASRGSRALLVGVGGDEWLCGSRDYYAEALATSDWRGLTSALLADYRDFGVSKCLWWGFRHGLYPLLPHGARHLLRNLSFRRPYGAIDTKAWLTPAMRDVLTRRREYYAPRFRKTKRIAQRYQYQILTGSYTAHALELEECLSSSVGIELRRPFLSRELIQFAFSTPARLRLQGQTDKALHRKAMRGVLPHAIVARDDKASFMVTFRWYLEQLSELWPQGLSGKARKWVQDDRVSELYGQCGSAQKGGWPEFMLWTLFGCDAIA